MNEPKATRKDPRDLKIGVTEGQSGFFAVLIETYQEGWSDVLQTGSGRYANEDDAKLEGQAWAAAEGGIPLGFEPLPPPIPTIGRILAQCDAHDVTALAMVRKASEGKQPILFIVLLGAMRIKLLGGALGILFDSLYPNTAEANKHVFRTNTEDSLIYTAEWMEKSGRVSALVDLSETVGMPCQFIVIHGEDPCTDAAKVLNMCGVACNLQ